MQRPYFDSNFPNQNITAKCSICLDVIYEATGSANCPHTYCKACISRFLESSQKCPDCNAKFDMQPNKSFELFFINNLKYHCKNGDCEDKFVVGNDCRNIFEHNRVCRGLNITCNYCKLLVSKKDIDVHKQSIQCKNAYITILENDNMALKLTVCTLQNSKLINEGKKFCVVAVDGISFAKKVTRVTNISVLKCGTILTAISEHPNYIVFKIGDYKLEVCKMGSNCLNIVEIKDLQY